MPDLNELNPQFDDLASFVGTVLAAIVAGMHRVGTIDAATTIEIVRAIAETDSSRQSGSFQGFVLMAEGLCFPNPSAE